MKKHVLFLLCVLMATSHLFAQSRTVTGRVTDENGNPLAGATVAAVGGGMSAVTSTTGDFTLRLPSRVKSVQVSFIGYTTQTTSISDQNTVAVRLATGNSTMSEVVVTAYGSTTRKAFTGTASTISSDKFKDLQVTSITGVLQGQASGVLAVSSNGQPGESPDIRIRGIGSVNASAAPLIVVDGAPYGGNINGINPNDIETITVLKDASSTALYGSRAANGVLLITTKSGRGTPKVSVSALTGYSSRAVKDYAYVNSNQLYELTWEALKNQAMITPNVISSVGATSPEDYATKTVAGTLVYNPFGVAEPVGLDGKIVSGAKNLWNENWADDLLKRGVRKDINLSVSGGNERTKYFLSGGFLDDKGLVIESDFKRYTGRFKVDTKVNDWLTVGVNTNLAYSTQNYPVQGGSAYSNVTGWIRNMSSIYPLYVLDPATGQPILDANGQKQYDFGNNGPLQRPILNPGNPAGTTAMNPTTYNRFTTSVNGYAEAQIITGLRFRSQYALDYYQFQNNNYYNPFVGDGAAYGGRSEKARENTSTQTFTNTLTYDRIFSQIHHVNILAGMEAFRYSDGTVDAESRGFTFPGVTELAYGSVPYTATSYSYNNRMVSYFSRVNYDLSDKYHLSLSLRTDGSSRFADSVRWGVFYSVGGAWNINRENFLSNFRPLSDLKLRASYGTTGNQAFLDQYGNPSYFPYLGQYGAGANIAGYSGSTISSLSNGKLTWETQRTLDLGIDFGFLKNRITGSFTYFTRVSDKLLFQRPLPNSLFPAGVADNVGKVTNKGVEMDLTTTNIRSKDFTWTTTINLTHIKNNIEELPSGAIAGANFSNLIVGQPLYNFYMREYAGVDLSDGTPLWWMDQTDASGKVIGKVPTKSYSAATRYYEGTSLPDWTGGISNTLRYKDLDLSVLASFSIGGKVYDADYAGLNYEAVGNTPGYNFSTDILGRWQSPTNTGDGKTPKLTATTDYQGNSSSTRFLFDASYARIRNITLGYRLPTRLIEKAKFSNVRIYADVQNPFTFFGRKGLDPETGLGGVTSNTSSVYKTISLGVNLNF